MNQPDDFDLGLRDRLSSAIGVEPPMESLPYDDLSRGRRLDRRRRWTAVGAVGTVVPALSLGAYAVAGGLSGGPGAGPTVLAPADGGDSTSPSNAEGTLTADCSVDIPGSTGGPARLQAVPEHGSDSSGASIFGLGPVGRSATGSSRALVSVGAGPALASRSAGSPSSGLRASAVPIGPGAQTATGRVGPAPSTDTGSVDCLAVDNGAPIDSPDVDRVVEALNRHVDPNGSHAGMTIAGGSVENPDSGGKASGIYAGYEWVDGNQTGMVSLSVEDPSAGNGDSCADPSSANGPEVICETRTLDDGTTVLVGRGQQDGAERITVRYVRPDGTLVWATADEATEQWWADQSGAAPLTSPPVTVDQLIDLVRDPDVRL